MCGIQQNQCSYEGKKKKREIIFKSGLFNSAFYLSGLFLRNKKSIN